MEPFYPGSVYERIYMHSKQKERPDYQFEVGHLAAAHSRADISAPERLRLSIALHLPTPRPSFSKLLVEW